MKKILFLLLAIVALLVTLYLTSCSTAYKTARDIKNLDKLFVGQPTESARLSNWLFPCFTGKAKSDTIRHTDTVKTKGDTSINTIIRHDTLFVTKTITKPGEKIYIKTTVTDTVTNDRKISDLTAQLKMANDDKTKAVTQLADEQKSKNTWMWIAIGCIGLITVTVVIKVYKLFSGGWVTGLIKKV